MHNQYIIVGMRRTPNLRKEKHPDEPDFVNEIKAVGTLGGKAFRDQKAANRALKILEKDKQPDVMMIALQIMPTGDA